MGIGSRRIAVTGRTAGILAKKREKQGITDGTKLGGPGGHSRGGGPGGGRRRNDEDELTFL